jgi:hypothetical protein
MEIFVLMNTEGSQTDRLLFTICKCDRLMISKVSFGIFEREGKISGNAAIPITSCGADCNALVTSRLHEEGGVRMRLKVGL